MYPGFKNAFPQNGYLGIILGLQPQNNPHFFVWMGKMHEDAIGPTHKNSAYHIYS
jgi:hypothetical protein